MVALSGSETGKTTYRLTDYLFWLMMLLISMPNILELGGIDTVFKPYRVISLLLACLAVPVVFNESPLTRKFSAPLLIAIIYGFAVTLLFGGEYAYTQIPLLLTCLALFYSTYVVTSRKSLLIGLYGSLISFVVTAAYGVVSFAEGDYRLRGLFENPNTLGYAGCFAILLAMNRYFPMSTTLRLFLIIGTSAVLVFSGSRSALAALAATVVSQLWRNKNLFVPLMMSCVALGIAGVLWGGQLAELFRDRPVFHRYSRELVEQGGVGRAALIIAGLNVAWEHGFVGVGIGQYRLQHHTRYFRQIGSDGQVNMLGTHNTYVSLLAEWGLVGFLCFATIVVRLVQTSRNLTFEKDWIYGFCAASLVNSIGNDLLSEVHFWVMLGVCVQLIRFAPRSRPATKSTEIG
jgi:O-antigen ligase